MQKRRHFALYACLVALLTASGFANTSAAYSSTGADIAQGYYQIQHASTFFSCLEIPQGHIWNGSEVKTAKCVDSDEQKWELEKRQHGAYAGAYRLISPITRFTSLVRPVPRIRYCLDNREDFKSSERMGIWKCLHNEHHDVQNQSVTFAAKRGGYTITFSDTFGNKVWLTADCTQNDSTCEVGQTTVSPTVPASAIWRLTPTDEPTAPQPHINDTVNPVINAAREKAAEHFETVIYDSDLRLISVIAVQWPSSAMGCEREGYAYATVMTPGWEVTYYHHGYFTTAHVSDSGHNAFIPKDCWRNSPAYMDPERQLKVEMFEDDFCRRTEDNFFPSVKDLIDKAFNFPNY